MINEKITEVGHRSNAFGYLRLLFAALVIASHTPELVDGDRSREILTVLGSKLSLGSFAVSGFFVISGYLITGSLLNSKSLKLYMMKRVCRIYPAFVVAFFISLLIVGPMGGGHFGDNLFRKLGNNIVGVAILARPTIDGAFEGQHHLDRFTALNGAMWTIQYEFACYILVALIGIAGGLRRPAATAVLALLFFTIAAFVPEETLAPASHPKFFPGPPQALPNMVGTFLVGATFYLFRRSLHFRPMWTLASAVVLAFLIRFDATASIGFAVFGGYVILAVAYYASGTWLAKVNDKTDISYGLYLYAWPIERLMIAYSGTTNLLVIGLGTLFLAAICGWASWTVVERPFIKWAYKRSKYSI